MERVIVKATAFGILYFSTIPLLSSLKLSFKERTKVYGYSVSVRQAVLTNHKNYDLLCLDMADIAWSTQYHKCLYSYVFYTIVD